MIKLKPYLLAIMLVLAMTGLRTVTHVSAQPMAFFAAAIATVAWLAGTGPAIVAAIVAALSSDFFLLEPDGFSFSRNVEPLLIFIVEALVLSVLIGRLRSQQSLAHERVEKAERLYDEAKLANEAKDRLLSEISHELRSPIHSMRLCLATLKSVGSDRTKLEALLVRMNRSTHMQARLVEDLLDFSRLHSGKLKLNLASVALEPLVRECVESQLPRAADKRIDLQFSSNGSEPPVQADPARVVQVLNNLIENAIKFTPEGGHVSVTVRSAGAFAIIRVADSGIGLAPEHINGIFERYQQVQSAAHGGLGLGLTISKEIAELHHGSLSVHSDGLGKGTQFDFALPVHAPVPT